MKYIDAERLKAEIERLYDIAREASYNGEIEGEMTAYDKILSFITSLQQEQPDVDFEKEIDEYFALWRQGASDEGCFNADSQLVSIYDCRRIARHFYDLGKSARKK